MFLRLSFDHYDVILIRPFPFIIYSFIYYSFKEETDYSLEIFSKY